MDSSLRWNGKPVLATGQDSVRCHSSEGWNPENSFKSHFKLKQVLLLM